MMFSAMLACSADALESCTQAMAVLQAVSSGTMLSCRQQLARRKWSIRRIFCRFSHVAILFASGLVQMDHPTDGESPAMRAQLSSWCVVHSVGGRWAAAEH